MPVAITGNTYPVRRELRDMGGEWDAGRKAWMVPDDKAETARSLVGGAGGGRAAARMERYAPRREPAPSASAKVLTVGGCISTIATLPGKFAGFFATIATVGLGCFAITLPYSNGRLLTCPDRCGCCS